MGALAGRKTYKNPERLSAMVHQNTGIILDSLAPSTLKTYNYVVMEFRQFVQDLDPGLNVFPVSPAHISLFMCHLFNLGRSPATVATKVSALAF